MLAPAGAAVLALALVAAPAQAQQEEEPRFILEVYGGVAEYGRFVEQLIDVPQSNTEYELTGGPGTAVGGSLGFFPKIFGVRDIAARLGFQWTTSDFEFEADDPRVAADDVEDVQEFDTFTGSLNVMKFLGDPAARIAPYGIAGVSGTWWSIDPEADPAIEPTADGDDTLFRWGGMGGLGLQARLTDAFAVRLEAARYSVRNPFDGDSDDAFGIESGITIEEPERVSINRFSLGLTYTLYK